ncbi:hypothetical protein [Bradyrhizobium japonicum]|uniref:hypothetical protein n=1 Tax=Bradyrhizobium japonicum TaxID=375 RepID=UPI002714E42D|nr:hypothetical protein [Bradyrhizobium japonicum]WLB53901.1 hypothetical protein QIH94_42980 [Bradyrhizobium japonicum]WLB64226.1 hypothetical protein QIH96_02810 [Bradyrhizobium japonicum]
MSETNVLQKLVDEIKRATTAVILTHNIDFMFAQAILVNRLRKCGSPRLTIFADAGCAAGSFNRQSEIADRVGRSFRVVPVNLGPGRRFHPKAIFLAGPEGASLAVGSGNLGHGGWSGNREIWTYFSFPLNGGPAIAAFRDYLEKVCDLADASEAVRATVLEPFRSEAWAADLPEPEGLLALPADAPLMDRFLARFEEPPLSFDLLVPYFDAEGVAVSDLARRLNVPMRVLIQHGKEGLSSPAAANLPASAQIFGVTPVENGRKTIHAKLYAAIYANRAVLIAGSANCSRAALLSRHNGNAELMAISYLSVSEYEELLSDIQISDHPPDLPEVAPNEDWDAIESPPVRILSASFEGGVMTVRCAFSAGVAPSQIEVVLIVGTSVAVVSEDGAYSFNVSDPGSRLWVEIDTAAGMVRSAPMWIDHEAELRIGRPEFNVQAKLNGNVGPISSDSLIDIFTLVVEHYNSPIRWAGSGGRKKVVSSIKYNLADVFSEGFGQRAYAAVASGGYVAADEWTLMNDYFKVGGSPRYIPDPEDPPEDTDGSPPELKVPLKRPKPLEPTQVEKLRRLIDKAVASMSSIAFLESRPPARLGADIRTAALLLAIARRREGVDRGKVDAASARLFHTLFTGNEGSRPLLDLYVEGHPEAPGFMQSSDLTAAMTLWVADLVNKPEAGPWFEFAATRLAAAHPWLIEGKEDRLESLERLSAHVGSLSEALPDIWLSWIQGGAAVEALMCSLAEPSEFLGAITRSHVHYGEIVWIGGQFAVAQADFDRKSKAELFLLRDARQAKFMGEKAIPIVDIIDKVDLPGIILDVLKRILTPAGRGPKVG